MERRDEDWEEERHVQERQDDQWVQAYRAVIAVLIMALGGVMWWILIDTRLRGENTRTVVDVNSQRISSLELRTNSLEKNFDRLLHEFDAHHAATEPRR